ncbi:MAG: ABC transporter permease subunit [Bacteroidota bacterium]
MAQKLGIAWFLTLSVLPLAAGLIYALLYSLGLAGILAEGFTLEYWQAVLSAGEIWSSLAYSTYIATAAMLIATLLALVLVLGLRSAFQKGLLSYVIYFPLAIPAMVAAFISFQLLGKAGFFSRLSAQLGLIGDLQAFPDLVNDQWGIGIIFSHSLMAFPFLLLLFLSTYEGEGIDKLRQLSRTLGAGEWEINRRVVVPILLWRNVPSLLLYFIFVLGSYEIPLLLGRETPQMVSVLTIRKLQRYDLFEKPEAYVIALIYCVMVLIAMVISLKRSKLLKAS